MRKSTASQSFCYRNLREYVLTSASVTKAGDSAEKEIKKITIPIIVCLIILGQFLFCLQAVAQVPSIASFTPTSGLVGTTVTITGTNFSTTLANNIVYFGATRATVTVATATQLTVTVPTGATFQPITVQVAGLTGFSSKPFVVTFAGGGSIDVCSFAPKVDFTAGTTPFEVAMADFDGDGKPDVTVANRTSKTLLIYRNSSTIGSIDATSLEAPISRATPSGDPLGLVAADMDGDGKLDIVLSNAGVSNVSVYRNTSTVGSLSFDNRVDYVTGSDPISTAVMDMDNDGKPEIVVCNRFSNSVSVLKNTSSAGGFTPGSFEPKVDFTVGSEPYGLAIADLDEDGKPDIVTANVVSGSVSVLRNIAAFNVINTGSFASKVDFGAETVAHAVRLADIDGDSKIDIVVASYSVLSVLRNITTSGITAGSFEGKVNVGSGSFPVVADIDGDGKIDIVANSLTIDRKSVFRNTATLGSISASSFAPPVDFVSGNGLAAIGDMDGDGKPDLVTANLTINSVPILRNVIGEISPPIITAFTPSSGPIGTSVTITGTNFSTPFTNMVKINGITAIINSSTATSLTVTIPAGATTGPFAVTIGCNTVMNSSNFTITPYVPFGNVVQLNGTNNLVVVADNISLQPQSLTIEAWVNFSVNQPSFIAGRPRNQPSTNTNSYGIYYSGGILFSAINSTQLSFLWSPTLGTWNHVALTYNNTTQTQTLYLNGTAVASSFTSSPILYTPGSLTIGSDFDFGSYSSFFPGKIDEFRFWNVERTQGEISSTINSTLTGNEPNLVGYYKMDEVGQGAGITAVNSATATGATLNGTTVGTSCTPIFTMLNAPTITSFSPAFGNTGAPITITGTNFDATPANNIVKFNGATATVISSSATSITATIPAGGSSGSITVQVGCNTATSSSNFIVPVCFPANGQNADVVLGQTNFTTNTSGSGTNKFTGGGGGVCIHHTSGKVFVTDGANHRVLRFSALSAATTGSSAEAVLGQPDFTTTNPGLSQTKMNTPGGIAIDQTTGTLWVTDFLNNRVLRFDNAISLPNGAPADGVLGQPDFTTSASPSVTATKLGGPIGLALDANGDLWTAERPWNRVLKFANAASLPNGAAASVVLGQTNFTSASAGTSQSTFNRTNGVAIDILGNLWVADELNDRVLKFANATSLTTGANATTVLGQTDFFGNSFATAQNRMYGPMTVHADIVGNLWVGDWANQRALQFANAASLSNGANATRVLGSPNFTTIAGGTAQNRTGVVWAIAVDNFGNVYVGDQGNNRILRFSAPVASSAGVSICANTSTTFTATGAVALQEYRWYDTPTGGSSVSSSSTFTTPALSSTTTYYLSLLDGGCSYESGRVPVVATITPSAPAPLTSSVSACGPSSSMIVTASGGVNGQYRWYTASTGGTPITGEVNDTYTTPTISATTSYYVSFDDGTCESPRTSVDAQIITPAAAPTVTGASDFPPAVLTLTASGGTNGQYRWYTTPTGGTALAGEMNGTYTTPSLSASTTYYVSIDNGQCESSRTPVVAGIKVNSSPVILSTNAEAPVEGTITISLTALISDPEDNLDFSTLTIVSQPISGARATIEPVNNLVLDYSGISFSGTDQLTIGICDQLVACSQKELNIEVVGDITVFNAISANGDDKNPVFFLKNIDILADTKENKVTIFNRWGDVVFEAENYDNVKQVFSGLNKNGDELPSSTYYYRIEFVGGKETKTGFIALKK